MDYGVCIQFRSPPDIELAFESLARERKGIELLNVKRDDNVTSATVFVPDGKIDVFEGLVRDYLEKNSKPSLSHPDGRPRNQDLVETIHEIRKSVFEGLWTDETEALPQSDDETIWWEVWLPTRSDGENNLRRFRNTAEKIGFEVSPKALKFPERMVLLMCGSKNQITRSMLLLNNIAELRRAKETAEFFDSLPQQEQRTWVDNLLNRTKFEEGEDIPFICHLDTGINRGHPLLEPALDSADLHTIEPDWGGEDENGHGTGQAGLSLYGDLTSILDGNGHIQVRHRLESVKILRTDGDNNGKLFGDLTSVAIGRPEINAPYRRRVFSMAVTAKDNRDRGKPSSWSAAIDQITSDSLDNGFTPRLIVISAGNVQDNNAWKEYPYSNSSDGIHDPGQAWNALTVGAYTEKIIITDQDAGGYNPIAKSGGLSPFSTTSMTWDNSWPLKPDVVFEGGNAARDSLGAVWMPSLSLLTTHFEPNSRLFTTSNATSAATALCARMAAQLMEAYPQFWPETIRAMIVHSAQWTNEMRRLFMTSGTPKQQYAVLIRHCGFGVPSYDRALWSAKNSLTLIAQDELQPFEKKKSTALARDMNLYDLPWPVSELENLGSIEVEMRVTLSYFIEPNPTHREFRGRYSYESHGLRFQVKRPTETVEGFRARINTLARDEEEVAPTSDSDPDWLLGPQLRHRGSLHSDIWRGEAAKLAQLGVLAVFPVSGWWKIRMGLERYHNKARYALIVSIHAPELEVDLYNVIEHKIKAKVPIVT